MANARVVLSSLLLSVVSALAQEGGAGKSAPAFEVASVKPANPSQRMRYFRGGPGTSEPSRLRIANHSLMMLIVKAYDTVPWRIVGPDWLDSDLFDVQANIPSGATKEQVSLMLQGLLAERFGLVVRREARIVPVYQLSVAKGGLKMKTAEKRSTGSATPATVKGGPALDSDFCPVLPPGVPRIAGWDIGRNSCWTGRMQSLHALAWQLEINLMKPVIDNSDLAGVYDFRFRFAPPWLAEASFEGTITDKFEKSLSPERAAAGADPAPDLFVAAEAQLGLKLQSAKAPVEVIFVEKTNRKPTAN